MNKDMDGARKTLNKIHDLEVFIGTLQTYIKHDKTKVYLEHMFIGHFFKQEIELNKEIMLTVAKELLKLEKKKINIFKSKEEYDIAKEIQEEEHETEVSEETTRNGKERF